MNCEDCAHEKVCEGYSNCEEAGLCEPKRPHGEWEFIGENLFMCTNCGYSADADYLRKWKARKYDSIFPTACLNCGAVMKKRGEAE